MSAHNTTVIITGAGGGLGKATATAFLAAGANVSICDVNQGRLTATEQEWTSSSNPAAAGEGHSPEKFLTTVADVTDERSVQALVAATVAKFGRLDVLINNAGIMDDFSPVGACPRELWDKVMAVNLLGPYNTSRAAIAQFEKQQPQQQDRQQGEGGGVIINICSVAALYGDFAGAAYTASKHGLLGLSRNTAACYSGKGIYTVALALGFMPTTNIVDGIADRFHTGTFERQQAEHPIAENHKLKVDNVAKYCLFLSDKEIAKGANGSTIQFTNSWPRS